MKIKTFGSICSGIEVASFVFEPLNIHSLWLSEISEFPKRFLAEKFTNVPNLGDMNNIPQLINANKVEAPDLLCGGTPCQAFSLAGLRNGINDDRGQLILKYIDIVDVIDKKRLAAGKNRTVFFWENVEGVLTDKSNAFGCFLAGLLNLDKPISVQKWSSAGIIYGKERNIAWRVMDAKYFGVPQQRKRVYLLGGGKDFHPENILFEEGDIIIDPFKHQTKNHLQSLFDDFEQQSKPNFQLVKTINNHKIEAFRSYSDCLYAGYGTKWNGNAAALNGSLFFVQDGRLRRLCPIECERLMGLPDNYTLIDGCKDTQRYQSIGNSWAVPVIQWIGKRLVKNEQYTFNFSSKKDEHEYCLYLLNDFTMLKSGKYLNASRIPYNYILTNMVDIADITTPEKFYISAAGCTGILRRKYKYNSGMNNRLEEILRNYSNY